jgi:hypothetical protein
LETFKSFESKIYRSNDQHFTDIALEIFHEQSVNNAVYASFIRNLGVDTGSIQTLSQIPFLPISFFKRHEIVTGSWKAETTFSSSGTTGVVTSRHAVQNLNFYLQHARSCFEYFLGDIKGYNFLALLPSYLERPGSSLVAMMQYFIKESQSPHSSFYLHNVGQMVSDVEKLKTDSRKTIVWGVSFALLDLVETFQTDMSHCIIFETGGMKGRRREMTRMELHDILSRHLNVKKIYSEYGMTEMFSQAYAIDDHRFRPSPWMRVMGREITDPLQKGLLGETSGINVIDLANWSTISFIETEDLGKVFEDGSFEVLGRMDNSDVRGCNLMIY